MKQITRMNPLNAATGALLILISIAMPSFIAEHRLAAQEAIPDGFQAYRLRHISADEMAPHLRNILSGVAGNPEVLVDRGANRVLVKGSQQAHQLAVETIRALDLPAQAPTQQRVNDSAPTVRGYPLSSPQREAAVAELRAKFPADSGVSISIDDRVGQILVVATPEIQRQVVGLLQSRGYLPPSQSANGPAIRSVAVGSGDGRYQLRNITWRELESSIQRMFGQLAVQTTDNGQLAMLQLPPISGEQAVMHVDRFRDQVHIVGSDQVAKPWEQIVWALDSPRGDVQQQTQLVPLRRANPAKVHRAVMLLRAAAESNPQSLDAERRSNLVSMIFQQDNQNTGGQGANRQPNPQATNQPNQNEEVDEDGGLIGDVQIEFIPELGIFIIRGHKRDVERVMEIIKDIEDKTDETQPEIEVYQLQHANSVAVAEMVNELYEQVFAPRQGLVTITALEKPNALLLIGRRENMETVINLIQKLDQPITASTQIQIFPLRHMSAVDAEEKITAFYEERTGLDTRVRVISDFRTNSLIVQASPRDLAEVKRLLDSIDVDTAPAISELRIFQLKNSLAADLADVLQEALRGEDAAAGGQQGATQAVARARSVILYFISVDDKGNKKLDESGLLSDVQVTADANANALVVRGPAISMDLIGSVIHALDQLPAAEALIKVFEIINGDATNLQFTLQTLFGQATTSQGGFGQAGGQLNALQIATSGSDTSLVPLRFAVDLRTNTIIATGSEGDLEVVEAIIARLDQADIESRRTIVYRLKNAPSDDVASALTDLLSRQTQVQQLGVTQQLVSPFDQIAREVIVVSEPVTNSLLVSATPRYFEEIKQVIEELDIRPPMVMIQVLIAEVKFDDVYEFGAEYGVQDALLFDRGLASVGFPFATAPGLGNDFTAAARSTRENFAGQGLTTFALGRTNPTLGYGGLVLSAANESLNVLVRALQDEGRLEILSRPQIMTLDNQAAFVQVGARVPRIVSSNITPQGGTQNSTQDEDVGLLLRVQPRISPDGLVVMLLDVEKSEVGPIAQGIPVAVDSFGNVILSPQINTTTAQTTISARSGQTVVFAGLITKSETLSTRGVPFLSDIPILGRLFSFESEIEQRTELLIIMTPYIVEDDEDVEFVKAIESRRMSWSLEDVTDVHGNVGLDNRYGDSQFFQPMIIYPDEDPTGSGEIVPEDVEDEDVERESKLHSFPFFRSSRRKRDPEEPRQSSIRPADDLSTRQATIPSSSRYREASAPFSPVSDVRSRQQPPITWNANVAQAGFQQPMPARGPDLSRQDSYYLHPPGASKEQPSRQSFSYNELHQSQKPYGDEPNAYQPAFNTPAVR